MKQLKLFPLSVMVFTHFACADFVNMYVDANSGYVLGQTTYRVFAVFDNPEDRFFGISGDVAEGDPSLLFNATRDLIQSCNPGFEVFCDPKISGTDGGICTQGSLLVTPGINGPDDSFLCAVGFNDAADVPSVGDDLSPYVNPGLDFSPGTFCSASGPDIVPIEGSAWSTFGIEGGGGTFTSPLGKNTLPGETGPLVWIAQFTLPTAASFTFTGVLNYQRNIFPGVPGGTLEAEAFTVSNSDATLYPGKSCSNARTFLASLLDRLDNFEPGELLDACNDGLLDFCQGESFNLRTFDCTNSGDADICDPELQTNGLPNLAIIDRNRDTIPDTCQCVADVNGDLVVDLEDIVEILFAFGTNSPDFNIVKGAGSTDPTWDLVDEADLDAVLTVALPQSPSDFENIASEVLLFGCDIENSKPLAPASSEGDDAKGSHYGQTTTSPSVPVTDADVSPYQVILGELHRFRLPSSPAEADSTKARDDGAEPPVLTEADDKLNIPVAVDPVADLLSYFKPSEDLVGKPDSKSSSWDLDADGLLDPWSVLILPLASWPEELRPFAELFRP